MSEQTTQRQQILDLNKIIDRQAVQLGKMQKRIDAAARVVRASESFALAGKVWHQEHGDEWNTMVIYTAQRGQDDLPNVAITVGNLIAAYTALAAAKEAGFETGSEE